MREWSDLPSLVYKSDPNYIPHIRQDIESIFDRKKNKLFTQGDACLWLLEENHRVIGRIAAFWSERYSSGQKQPTGGIGFFECTENSEAAHLLLETACTWLKQAGMEAADGPINFGEKEAYWGLLVMNFTDMSSFRMNYNPPYYQRFFEDYGFRTYYEQWCYKRDIYLPAQEVFVRKNDRLMADPSFRISSVRGKTTEQIASDFVTVYNAAWAGHSGFKRMELAQALKAIKAMSAVMDPDIIVFVYHHDKPIAFYVNLPEVNEFMKHIGGNLNLWGKVKFLYHKKFSKRTIMVGMIFGVDRAYHGQGVEGAMITWSSEHIAALNRYSETILTWIGDFNPKMVRVAENLGAHVYRKLITYRKHFDEKTPFERHPVIL